MDQSRNTEATQDRNSVHTGPQVLINGLIIPVEIASTPEAIQRGLSHRTSLAPNKGMLFLFDHNGVFKFWMKGMRFPLDFIWIDEQSVVVDVTPNVPTVPLFKRPVFYSPSKPARYVLEVNAGFCAQHTIQAGTRVQFNGVSI